MLRRAMIFPLILILCLVSFSGCGNGDSVSQPTTAAAPITVTVSGKVELPAGSTLKPEKLQLVTCVGAAAVSADGSYSAKEAGSGPALAFVTNEAGNPLLMGFVQGGSAGQENNVNAQSTATAMLFQALPAYTLPRGTWPQVLSLLEDHPATEQLTLIIAQRFAANPNVLAEQDAAIRNALQTAVESILAETALPSTMTFASKPMIFRFSAVSSTSETPAMVTVEPGSEISGIRVGPNTEGNGIVITNNLRRHLWAYVYKTGYKTKDDDENTPPRAVDPWEPLSSQGIYIQAVNGFQATIGTVLDAMLGQVAYSPVSSEAIILPVEPNDAVRTYYTAVVVGAAWTAESFEDELPAEYLPHTAEVATWKQAQQKMDALTLFQELLFPAVLTVFPVEAIGEAMDSKMAAQMIEDITKFISNRYPQFIEQITTHDYHGALLTFLKAFDNDMLRDNLVEKMIRAGLLRGGVTMSAAAILADLNIYASAIDKFLAAGDLGLVVSQLCSASQFTAWSCTAVKPYIRIQNNPSVVTAGLDVAMTCYGTAGITGIKEYEWKTAGVHGHLEDTHGNAGVSFTSTDQSVRYVADENAADGDEDSVSVTAWLKENGKKQELGQAQADVMIVDAQRDLMFTPAAPAVAPDKTIRLDVSILPSLPDDVEVTVEWTCTNEFGTLAGPENQKVTFTGQYANYVAGKEPGTDTITATAWRLNSKGKRVPICSKTVTVQVSTSRMIHSTLEPYLDDNKQWCGAEYIFLVFPKAEGAKRYFLTWHTNGFQLPADAEKSIQAWQQQAKFDQSTMIWRAMLLPYRMDGEREEVFPLDGSSFQEDAALAKGNIGLLPGEVAVPVLISLFGSQQADKNAVLDWYKSHQQVVDTITKWTVDIDAGAE